ncbi:HORMA domain-containing protein 1 isoform X2 [Mugil cephalus]|uniref:HORMA domain-containing protein 1 isoform X2 n=1 Tax=Mugil cephalus TaxID=48193 RepID=UPI001FB6D668|nr:HORMA domain-containing protein 1 isoform X2 [Mugil cephalus]
MACGQRVRTSQETQLAPNQVLTEQQSLVVVKKLLAIAVSSITYLRGVFPGRAYGSKYVEDQQVMVLKEERSCPAVMNLLHWMHGCFEAIQKKYLRTVIMSIYTDPESPQKVTEVYQFKIQYTAKGPHMDLESTTNNKVSSMPCGTTKKASILMVRKLYTLIQSLGPLPENVCLSMRLTYYDDVTPQDYQPPGFKEADGAAMEFEQEPVKLTMGEVNTPFHTLKLDMATERHRLEEVEESVQVTEKWVVTMEDEVEILSHAAKDVEEADNKHTDLDNTEIQSFPDEVHTEMDTLVRRTSDMEVGPKRTRSGKIIRSPTTNVTVKTNKKKMKTMKEKMVSQYDIPSSQEMPSTSVPKKKRKFSEPKEHV